MHNRFVRQIVFEALNKLAQYYVDCVRIIYKTCRVRQVVASKQTAETTRERAQQMHPRTRDGRDGMQFSR